MDDDQATGKVFETRSSFVSRAYHKKNNENESGVGNYFIYFVVIIMILPWFIRFTFYPVSNRVNLLAHRTIYFTGVSDLIHICRPRVPDLILETPIKY